MTLWALVLGFAAVAQAGAPIRALTYSSISGKGALGEVIQAEFRKSCVECALEFVNAGSTAGLLGRLRADAKRAKKFGYDVVIGLNDAELHVLRQEGRVLDSRLLDRGAYALIVDSEKLPPAQWPRRWSELPAKLSGKILVQDPRTSGAGMGWLRAIFEMKSLDAATARKLTARVYPGWSEAYSAFTKGRDGALAVWSYAGSAAYHACEEKTRRYRALPLEEGYPVQEEWVVLLRPLDGSEAPPRARQLLDVVQSPAVQSAVPSKQWMSPAVGSVALPECYLQATREIREWRPARPPEAAELLRWTDEWSR